MKADALSHVHFVLETLRLAWQARLPRRSTKIWAQRAAYAAAAPFLLSACSVANGGDTVPQGIANALPSSSYRVNDAYTMSSRYEGNRPLHPEFALPELSMQAGQRIQFDRRYKVIGDRELHMDIFLPAIGRGNGWGVLLLHGGGWSSGNKSNFYTIANGLAQRGYTVFLPEFRLSPEALYPAAMQDSHDALTWIVDHSPDYAINPANIAVGGESSGGQMATLLAYTGGQTVFSSTGQAAPKVAALLNIDGVMDFTTPLALHYENAAGDASAAGTWLGGAYERVPDRWREASGARYVDAQSPATLVISGKDPRFTAGFDTIFQSLNSHGIRNAHVHFDGLPHTFWLFEPYASQIVDTIDQFLQPKE